ncbi:MAG: hypothetical protein ACI89E_001822, partial [Planctomycetota bacterium]
MNSLPPQRPRWIRSGKRMLKLIFVGYALILLALVFFEARLVYPGAYMDERAQWAPAA